MTHAGYIAAGWLVSVLSVATYALVVLLRGRKLSRSVPSERRRWLTSEELDGSSETDDNA